MKSKLRSLALVVTSLAALLSSFAIAQDTAPAKGPTAKVVRPELVPIADVVDLPCVLLLGDTVSVGYTLPTRKLLDGKANVHRNAITTALKEPPPSKPTTNKTSKGFRVFTCGHSFHVWIVPLLSEMAIYAGITDHQIAGRSSIGGSMVMKHWDVPDDKNTAKQLLNEGKVDVLTLSPIWLPDEGIENFAKLAFEHNPDVRITVQEYWLPNDEYNPVYPLDTKKKLDHNATTIPALRDAQDRYDYDIDAHVRAINKKLGKDALVTVPVGKAVVALRERIIAGECPGIAEQSELFRDNWGHPTQPIMALAGYCHFAVIYKRSPVGLPRPAILTRNPAWDEKLNRLLQELAWEAVTKHPMSGVTLGAPSK